MTQLTKPTPFNPFVTADGITNQEATLWIENITQLSTANGTGDPNGVISGPIGRAYVDIAAAPGAVFYVKQLNDVGGDTSLGWILIG